MDGFEFHKFDAGVVGIVEVELPLAVAADFGLCGGLPAVLDELLLGGVDVRDAKSDMIHNAEGVVIGVWRNIDHELDPVTAIGDLKRHPVSLVFLHAAMPVRTEAEEVFVEMLFGGAVADDEAGMN